MASFRTPCLLFCLLVSLCLSASTSARSGSWCPNANLNALLSTLSSDILGKTGFYNVSYGQGTDEVNAIALCRGDIGEDDCRSCITSATEEVNGPCPNEISETVWLEKCMLRYSNASIFGKFKNTLLPAVTTSAKYVSNPNQYNQTVLTLLDGLKDEAAAGNSLLKFATGSAKVSDSESVYALLQCTPDLCKADCKDCLSTATRDPSYLQICKGKQDCRVTTDICNLRYENYRFYNSLTDMQPPASPPAANTATRKRQIKGRLQILATLVATLFCFRY